MIVTPTQVTSILTRTSGYLESVASHSLQPYRGCALGHSLCGVACYVRHNMFVTRGREWGDFVEPRINAAAMYRRQYPRERNWARGRSRGKFCVFLSSSTEPFQPAETKYRVTRSVLEAMRELPPDELIVQTHSHRVLDAADVLCQLKPVCGLRVHVSIESDRETLPGLPKPASPIERRVAAGRALRDKGIFTVATLAPLLPIENPERFFAGLQPAFDAVVIDHFIGGDGSAGGSRTRRTALPQAMALVEPASVTLAYRDQIVATARKFFDRVGVGCAGFAGVYSA